MYTLPKISNIAPEWYSILEDYLVSEDYLSLMSRIESESNEYCIYPESSDIFRALVLTKPSKVKVVMIGQDPYHGPKQANGLAFSVSSGVKLPPSLKNIFKELAQDLGTDLRQEGDLSDWARQGILLLNRVLTVRAGQAGSHQNLGWEEFTQEIVKQINQNANPVIFVLWGKSAQTLEPFINLDRHSVIKSVHPSPLSAYRGFFGSKPFSHINSKLKATGQDPIAW